MAANPAYDLLFNPSSAGGSALTRLRDTSITLAQDGLRTKDVTVEEWVTVVEIGRANPDAPPVGRLGPMLRASGRVFARSAAICAGVVRGARPSTGDYHSLLNAIEYAAAARSLCRAHAKNLLAQSDYFSLFGGSSAERWALLHHRGHSDLTLIVGTYLDDMSLGDWRDNSRTVSIGLNANAQTVIASISGDFSVWLPWADVLSLSEMLATGVEVAV